MKVAGPKALAPGPRKQLAGPLSLNGGRLQPGP